MDVQEVQRIVDEKGARRSWKSWSQGLRGWRREATPVFLVSEGEVLERHLGKREALDALGLRIMIPLVCRFEVH